MSTALSSAIKLSAWGKYLGDATLAAAVLDRLAMNSIYININGSKYRLSFFITMTQVFFIILTQPPETIS